MGLQPGYLDYIQECVTSELGDLAGKRMLELGDQTIGADGIPEKTGKEYYENRGVQHTSFDLNAKHGALPVDLAQPIRDPQWRGAFDIITNSGGDRHPPGPRLRRAGTARALGKSLQQLLHPRIFRAAGRA
jgi:hypothetical protein